MSALHRHDITRLLQEAGDAREGALEALLPLVYDELRALARRQHLRFSDLKTLNTTALVHEVYLKLFDQDRHGWESRRHFFGVAARAMRHMLLDYARAKKSQKRGGDLDRVSLDEVALISEEEADELLALDAALKRLEALSERQSQVVECRFFGGLTVEETAAVLDVSPITVKRDWRLARLWLFHELQRDLAG